MGASLSEKDKGSDESEHLIRLTENFEIQATEVTQLQWLMVMKGTDKAVPSRFTSNCDHGSQARFRIESSNGSLETVTICKNHPVEKVSWVDIAGPNGFLEKLNDSQSVYTYRLPTEAEWEYAARGGKLCLDGTYPRYSFGDDSANLDLYGWYGLTENTRRGNSDSRTHAVAQKKPNGYGIYDMHGNVWEWVFDFYDKTYGLSSNQLGLITENPTGPSTGYDHVIRGGAWSTSAQALRSASRTGAGAQNKSSGIGFRLVRTRR